VRRLSALAVLALLVLAVPAFADMELDPDKQTAEYGHMFSYICGVGGAAIVIVTIYLIIKQIFAEGGRGKKVKTLQEQMLDDAPKKKEYRVLYLGEKVPDWKTANRLAATVAALKMLGKKDDWWDPKNMSVFVERAFKSVKAAIETRSSKKIKDLVTPACLEKLKGQMAALKADKELHIYGKPDINGIEIVHFEAAGARTSHSFTALVSAVSKDFIQSEKTGEVLKGDRKYYEYQEFWRFQRTRDNWLVDQIRSSSDMDVIIHTKCSMNQADLDKLAKTTDQEVLREIAGK
jgi:hypothetical protein